MRDQSYVGVIHLDPLEGEAWAVYKLEERVNKVVEGLWVMAFPGPRQGQPQ